MVNQETLCVSRVLRILKVSEQIGYTTCIQYCLEYLEAVPWVGQEEEEKVVSLVCHLEGEGIGVKPVLKRVSPEIPTPPNDTLSHILELVLKSREEKDRKPPRFRCRHRRTRPKLPEYKSQPKSKSIKIQMLDEICDVGCNIGLIMFE
ncbi:BTB/POZ domain-containing protein At3g50780-like [Salvia miltiorrhiza]|uniref:BTB/POZ domain-containing protein At3g50780-like n=1 Tax=Salvia miltiorrhiza TaxID=226208 RepID=UPI0025AC956E|nr:BTB/POZ domain-containing protein At3g50780-like [Salvia miltiorrhiza]